MTATDNTGGGRQEGTGAESNHRSGVDVDIDRDGVLQFAAEDSGFATWFADGRPQLLGAERTALATIPHGGTVRLSATASRADESGCNFGVNLTPGEARLLGERLVAAADRTVERSG
jgi:hypothetical protein